MGAWLNVIEMWLNMIEILLIDFNQDVIALDWNITSFDFNHNQSRSIIARIFRRHRSRGDSKLPTTRLFKRGGRLFKHIRLCQAFHGRNMGGPAFRRPGAQLHVSLQNLPHRGMLHWKRELYRRIAAWNQLNCRGSRPHTISHNAPWRSGVSDSDNPVQHCQKPMRPRVSD